MCPQGQKGLRRYDFERHKQSSNSIKRYGVALMFLRAHGRKSMPVCLEALLFLCSFVLMFSALAADPHQALMGATRLAFIGIN